jgi:phytoene synthase
MSKALALALRRADPDRYFSALTAPAEKRPHLIAIYSLNHEFARVGETVREPMLGEIRLQWWREALAEARAGRPRRHDVVEALTQLFSTVDLPQGLFEQMIDARTFDISTKAFANDEALDAYLDATSGNVMRIAARVLGSGDEFDSTASAYGVAYGLVGVARSLALHAGHGKCFAPLTALDDAGLGRDALLEETHRPKLKALARAMASRALERYRAAKQIAPRDLPLPAFLPASLVPLYARGIRSVAFDPSDVDVAAAWRLATLLGATIAKRI